VGLEEQKILQTITENLTTKLIDAGFEIEKKKFVPHITLARELEIADKINVIVEKTTMDVDRISLMKSERIDNKLVYSEIFSKEKTIN